MLILIRVHNTYIAHPARQIPATHVYLVQYTAVNVPYFTILLQYVSYDFTPIEWVVLNFGIAARQTKSTSTAVINRHMNQEENLCDFLLRRPLTLQKCLQSDRFPLPNREQPAPFNVHALRADPRDGQPQGGYEGEQTRFQRRRRLRKLEGPHSLLPHSEALPAPVKLEERDPFRVFLFCSIVQGI